MVESGDRWVRFDELDKPAARAGFFWVHLHFSGSSGTS